MFDLQGKVALVTGAGQGVGEGIARALAGRGAEVAVNDVVAERAEAVAGAIRVTRSLALEVARSGVTANTLAIGLMGMPDPDITAALARSIPVGRTGVPADIAAAVVWLASDEAGWVTGQTIQINGGSITT